jgi:hypothetical protein
MLPPTPSDFTVAMAGLALLPATRLKVACSLLAADRLTVRLVEWGTEPATLLVADETTPEGRHAVQSARQGNVASIRLGGTGSMHGLQRLSTVREFADALKSGLQGATTTSIDRPSAWDSPLPSPMLEHLRLDRPRNTRVLLEQGLFRVVCDARSGELHMLRRMPLDELLERALKPDWRVTDVSEREWQSVLLPDVTGTYAIETLWWRLRPTLADDVLPRVEEALRLRAWPDLDAEGTPASWPLLLANLVWQPWQAGDLAGSTGTQVDEVHQVMALIRLSGLEASPSDVASPGMRASALRHAGSMFKIAKRFGLKLLGKAHG